MATATQQSEPALTMAEIIEMLSDNMRRVAAGDVQPAQGNAVATTAGVIFRGIKLQMEYARMLGRKPEIAMLAAGIVASENATAAS